jgi:ribosome modulation factor
MGRELRMVPSNWEHPKDADGRYIPLIGRSYSEAEASYEEERTKWFEGYRRNYVDDTWVALDNEERKMTYLEWNGHPPNKSNFMPDWPQSERTHFQMYENTTEGTPISPPMETPEELAQWLADNGASAFGTMTATREQWLDTIRRGYSCGMIAVAGRLTSGVAGLAE